MKSYQRSVSFVCLFLILLFISSCSHFQNNISEEDRPLATYVSARAGFNNILETYLNFRDSLPDSDYKQAIVSKYQGKFHDANKALNVWKVVVESGANSAEAIAAYTEIIDAIVMELIQDKIMEME